MVTRDDMSVPTSSTECELNILLIEPHAETRELLELALSARGHSVITGADAEAAWHAVQHTAFDLIVVDRDLSDIDGLRLCRHLRSLPRAEQAVILVIAGQTSDADRAAAIDAGADDYIAWPANAVQLRHHIEGAEQRARSRPSTAPAADRHTTADSTQPVAAPNKPAGPAPLLVLDPDGTIHSAATEVDHLLGFDPAALTGASAFTLLHTESAPALLRLVTQALSRSGPSDPTDVRLRRHDDTWHTAQVFAVSRLHEPDLHGIAIYLQPAPPANDPADDDEGRSLLYNATTGLPNFALFFDRLEHALQRANRRAEQLIVLVVSLDDMAGAEPGTDTDIQDRIANDAGRRMTGCVRAGDTIARIADMEFAAIIEGIAHLADATAIAKRIVQELASPFVIDDREVNMTPVVGMSASWEQQFDAAELLRRARIANQHAAGQSGAGGHYALYDERFERGPATGGDATTPEPGTTDSGEPEPHRQEAWFIPLIQRIDALEREIARLTAHRAAQQPRGE